MILLKILGSSPRVLENLAFLAVPVGLGIAVDLARRYPSRSILGQRLSLLVGFTMSKMLRVRTLLPLVGIIGFHAPPATRVAQSVPSRSLRHR